MVKMVNFMLHTFYHTKNMLLKKKAKKEKWTIFKQSMR